MNKSKLNMSNLSPLKIFKGDKIEYDHVGTYDSARTDKGRELAQIEKDKENELNKKNENILFFPKQSKILIDKTNRYYDILNAETNNRDLNSDLIGGTYEYLPRRDLFVE